MKCSALGYAAHEVIGQCELTAHDNIAVEQFIGGHNRNTAKDKAVESTIGIIDADNISCMQVDQMLAVFAMANQRGPRSRLPAPPRQRRQCLVVHK